MELYKLLTLGKTIRSERRKFRLNPITDKYENLEVLAKPSFAVNEKEFAQTKENARKLLNELKFDDRDYIIAKLTQDITLKSFEGHDYIYIPNEFNYPERINPKKIKREFTDANERGTAFLGLHTYEIKGRKNADLSIYFPSHINEKEVYVRLCRSYGTLALSKIIDSKERDKIKENWKLPYSISSPDLYILKNTLRIMNEFNKSGAPSRI